MDNLQRLQHIQKAIEDIHRYVSGQTLQSFNDQPVLQDAVLLQFMIIGESVTHIEIDKLEKYPYPWYKVKAFRNMIAHEYFNIKMSAVWQIIEHDLAGLQQIVELMLTNER